MIRLIATVALCTQLSGCFFIWIPGSLIQKASDGITGARGEHCVGRAAVVGERINFGAAIGTVKSLSGESVRCTNPAHPIRAEVEF